MKPSKINKWRLTGSVFLWRYLENTHNYPGWHLCTDQEGGRSILNLVNCFHESQHPVHRTLSISSPNEKILSVPNNQEGRAQFKSPSKLRIEYYPKSEFREKWLMSDDNTNIKIEMGSSFLKKFEQGITDLLEGKGDYSIGHDNDKNEENCLWFWWHP